MSRIKRRASLAVVAVLVAGCLGGCGAATGVAQAGPGGTISVVAAENFWGSIAGQLGGDRVTVTSIVTNPDTDPHSYEATARDGRAFAAAQFVIVNGVGYDPWAESLLDANATKGRTVLDVGKLVGVAAGGNPHRWYDPQDVGKVIEQITADYARIDPKEASYFEHRMTTFSTRDLAQYHHLIKVIKAEYAGTPIGASESIVTPLAAALGLRLLTPQSFLDAVSEGNDPTAADKATIDAQIQHNQIKIYVYNSQNATPDVTAQVQAARSRGIPVATVTETLDPAGDTFEAWQVHELRGIQAALASAGGR
ncbi:MAG TPA: zinc ABC transporter substrate-binding protein [Acidimicrobiales bacterium]|nr:zinc ABC transporter substrate-binding protein [Acidimicrobiales bacterium]